jgi:hypothetical protein
MTPTLEQLRVLAELRGVAASDDDLLRVQGFLDSLLPAFAELEALLEVESAPVDLAS